MRRQLLRLHGVLQPRGTRKSLGCPDDQNCWKRWVVVSEHAEALSIKRLSLQSYSALPRMALKLFPKRSMMWFFFLLSHTSHLLLCSPTDGAARIYLFNLLIIEHARAPFQRVWVQLIPNSYTREGEKPFEQTPRDSNPGLLRGKQVRYPLHHCLSGILLVENYYYK